MAIVDRQGAPLHLVFSGRQGRQSDADLRRGSLQVSIPMTGTAESLNLAVATTRRQTVWISGGIHPHWRQVLATFAELTATAGLGPVADLGCGTGRITAHLESLGLDAFGVDLSPAMVDRVRDIIYRQGWSLHYSRLKSARPT